MRRRKPLWAACLGACLALATVATSAVEVRQAAPEIEFTGSTSAPMRLSQLRGKVVYLDFWASWCAPCRRSFPWMNEMQRKYGARGLAIVAVNLDAKRSDADAFLAQRHAQFALAFDAAGESARRFSVKGMPTSILIGRDGTVLSIHQGFRDDDLANLEAGLRNALTAP